MPGAEDTLHDVGRVSADRDHLAVRHIDHAHQSEGDRESDRDDQQNAAGGKSAEKGADGVYRAHMRGDLRETGVRGSLHFGRAVLRKLTEQILAGNRSDFAEFPRRGRLHGGIFIDELRECDRLTDGAFHARVCFFLLTQK